MSERTYLGDGAYAERDGYGGIVLVTSNGLRDTNRIVLEPLVFEALLQWALTPAGFDALRSVGKE